VATGPPADLHLHIRKDICLPPVVTVTHNECAIECNSLVET